MGILAELETYRAAMDPADYTPQNRERWATICVCGHEDLFHGVGNGGSFGVDQIAKQTVDGCRGATPGRDESFARPIDADGTIHYAPTCPCKKVRPIAAVDRPGRGFRQKTYTRDYVHPFDRGLRALLTRLSNSKTYGHDPDTEFERRLQWIEKARVCAVCGSKKAVMPAYANTARDSEMRCERHYREPFSN
jgi:hypothetical protein